MGWAQNEQRGKVAHGGRTVLEVVASSCSVWTKLGICGSSGNPGRTLVLDSDCLEAFTSPHFTGKSPVPSLLPHLALFFMNSHLGPGDMVQRPRVHSSLPEDKSSGLTTPYDSRYRGSETLFWPPPAPAPTWHLLAQTHTYK